MHETIEGEVILIDLDTGTYYSLRDTGAVVWQGIQDGAETSQIVDTLTSSYEGASDEIVSAVADLLEELTGEGLIEPVDGDTPAAGARVPSVPAPGRPPFRAPVLEKHTDMQDLILLDPVHEVDARGWPHPAPSDSAA
jgi:hypothetical protein